MELNYWIIVHRPTGHVLPGRQSRRGYTHDAPTLPVPQALPVGPRLFTSAESAHYCLERYCMGVWMDKGHLGPVFRPVTATKPLQDTGCFVPDPATKRDINDFVVLPLKMNW